MASPIPVLLVTDIGRDIDDTVALLALSTYQMMGQVKLVGAIATGGAGQRRAQLTRFWLRRLGYDDKDVPVGVCLAPGKDICLFPSCSPGVPALEDAALYQGSMPEKSAAELILHLVDQYEGKLQILAIAPVSALAAALETQGGTEKMQKGIAKLLIQGQATVGEGGRLAPDFLAFNLSENKEASNTVFEKLQDHVPFELLSKHAAYRVTLKREHFEEWDDAAGEGVLVQQAKEGLTTFRKDMPEVFHKLYPMPEDQRGPDEWFKALTYISHPYDPLLTVASVRPELFELERVPNKSGRGDHGIIGRVNQGTCGVPDADAVRDEVRKVVREACQRILDR